MSDVSPSTDQRDFPLIIFTVGTAASGKSSWAEAMRSRHTSLRIGILERDMIRVELFEAEADKAFSWGDWNPDWENKVQCLWEQRVQELAKQCDALILADTHLDAVELQKKALWLRKLGATEITLQYFPALPLTELLRRDQGRSHPVGGEALREHLKKIGPEEQYWAAIEGV
ncbi:AAA family ATPase [Acidithiobacillus sp. M4-SHS-6]|uniref:AAA family ATPase n=1 Tax=Acidithiobacillus sp. M4-SHS-6 TaxID=3383024 RepID=UPI0039BDC7ED